MAGKTEELPGVEGEGVSPKKIRALDTAIDAWRDLVEKRMALTKREVEARDKVIELMHKNALELYIYQTGDDEQKKVILDSKEKLSLKRVEESATDIVDD